jgi:hypothetical protein
VGASAVGSGAAGSAAVGSTTAGSLVAGSGVAAGVQAVITREDTIKIVITISHNFIFISLSSLNLIINLGRPEKT